MGYTHYWSESEISKENWEKVIGVIKSIAKKHEDVIQREYDDNSKPIIDDDEIMFNGIDEDGHETFHIGRESRSSFNFCKTARKPYDIAVCESLLVLNALCPEFSIKSDGFSSYLDDSPEIDGCWAEAVKNVQEYGIYYDIEVTEERAPYCDIEPVLNRVEE